MKDKHIHVRAAETTVARLTRLTDTLTASQADIIANALKLYEYFVTTTWHDGKDILEDILFDVDTGTIYIRSEVEKELRR